MRTSDEETRVRPAVRERRGGGWDVIVDGHNRAIEHHASADLAVQSTRDLFNWNGPVTVYNRVRKVMRHDVLSDQPAETTASETSPSAVIWTVVDPTVRTVCPDSTGIQEHSTDRQRMIERASVLDVGLNRQDPDRKHRVVQYVDRDAAMPSVSEILTAIVGENKTVTDGHRDAACSVYRLLRARLEEGDRDEDAL